MNMNTWARLRHELMAIVLVTLLLLAMAMVSPPVASAAEQPKLQSNGAVEYLSGGVGKEEADALKQQSADYALTLEFASSRSAEGDASAGAYVADVKVDIRDAQGRPMLNTTSTGPLLLVRLPPGDYTVVADWNGVRKQHSVDIPDGARRHVVFMW
ncbi:MAG TPA: carboxypeptidase regulatory-like domain-containing protein [Casimicrobiaceae bacterium]|nr:carboxypeptidase regulatory-like domain-containing protein [Casimicrobiaceae bacterium]